VARIKCNVDKGVEAYIQIHTPIQLFM